MPEHRPARLVLCRGCSRYWRGCLILLAMLVVGFVPGARAEKPAAAKPAFERRGFYLHGAWKFNYPFAVRSWKADDYHRMFLLLDRLGFNTVMMWPVLEAVPMPLSATDRDAVRGFRAVIQDAQDCGLEVWLTQCAVTSDPEIAAKPWMERSLYAHMKTVRLDRPDEAKAFLRHRTALLEILNNADGYVTIDGDPGGYPGAKPSEFLAVLLNDRRAIDRFGTHPKTQKVIPWIWCGWGTKGIWQEPIEPFVTATLEAFKRQMPEPWELLPGRSHETQANRRINMDLVKKAGLLGRSTLYFYEAIEYEPFPPAARLQLDDIRDAMRKELALSPGARGCFGNAQQPIMVLPNLYFFARCAQDPAYLDRSDKEVLFDLAAFLGGPPESLIPAWSCLRLKRAELPADLPGKLRHARLRGPTAALLPGGPERYLTILAAQVESRIDLLDAIGRSAKRPADAATAIADATAALVDWWKLHRYVGGAEEAEPFGWRYVEPSQYARLRAWCAKNVTDAGLVAPLAVKAIVDRGVLDKQVAEQRVREVLTR